MAKANTSKKTNITAISSIGQTVADQEEGITLLTREGLKKLQEELQYLVNVRRREVAKRLREAISYGDLSENSEYEEAKTEQAFVEGRVLELERKIKSAKIIDEHHKKGTVIQLGMKVKVRNLSNRNKENEEFTIVGSTEADPFSHRISNESPLGKAILGGRLGDVVDVLVPAGARKYEIMGIE